MSVILVSLISFAGAITIFLGEKKFAERLLLLVSFSAGALFGDVFLHIFPEMASSTVSLLDWLSVLSGILLFFVVEKFILWRHCHLPISPQHPHSFTLMNLLGDSVHNFIDGLIIGASYLASLNLGVATTVAIVAHEIPHELGNFGVLVHGGFSRREALFFNFLVSLTALAGTLLAFLLAEWTHSLAARLLPLAAGGFIYIAGTDLIPELHKEVGLKTSFFQLFTLLLGIALMWLLRVFFA